MDRSISWNGGDAVNYVYHGSGPDRGAYEAGIDEAFGVQIISPAEGGVVSGRVNVQVDVSNPEAVRYVIFMVDGIPVAASHESPFELEWDTTGWSNRAYTIETRAYARHAGPTLWQDDQRIVEVQDQAAYPEGDVNRDGEVDVADVHACANHILSRQNWGAAADVNGDEVVNVLDVQEIVRIISAN